MALHHGLEGVFRPERVDVALETIRKTSVALSEFGAVVFCEPGAELLEETEKQWDPGYWGALGEHVLSTFVLAMTYMYRGQREFGLDLAQRTIQEAIRRGLDWGWPSNRFAIPPSAETIAKRGDPP